MPLRQPNDSECNCPPPRDVWCHGVGTKPPCPVHDDQGMLAKLAKHMVPAKPVDFDQTSRVNLAKKPRARRS